MRENEDFKVVLGHAASLHNRLSTTRLEQHDCSIAERSERLLSVTVILTRTQPHVNGNNSGVFIFISRGNGLIGLQSFSE